MSVILTAARKKPPKSAKPKKKRTPRPVYRHRPQSTAHGSHAFDTPPVSSGNTVVWHWELDGVPTTVMFSKDRDEIWCNGEIVEKLDTFTPESNGALIDFVILTNGKVHRGRIKRMMISSRKDGMSHQLFVDGYMILEHTTEAMSPYDAITPIEDDHPPNEGFNELDDSLGAQSYGAAAHYSSILAGTSANRFPQSQGSPPPPYDYNNFESKKDI